MDFALTEDQILIRDAAENFLGDVSNSAAVRVAAESETGLDEGTWQRIGAELGWCAISIPEEFAGLGLGPVELALILEQMGRRLLCAPFFSTVCVAANLLMHTASDAARQRFLPSIAEGRLRATASLPSGAGDWAEAVRDLRARRTSDGWMLDGHCARVPDGASPDWFFAFAQLEGGEASASPALFAVPRDARGLRVEALAGWDATRRFARIEMKGMTLPAEARIDDASRVAEGLIRSAALARLAIAAEQLGGAQQCLDLTVAYTADRKQFGRAIGSFQAVKHRCAEMMVRIEALRSAVYGAAAFAVDAGDAGALAIECAMARALASDTFFYCAQEAVQLHGGVGFTWEFDPQLYFKRAQASSHWLGTADALRERIAQSVIG